MFSAANLTQRHLALWIKRYRVTTKKRARTYLDAYHFFIFYKNCMKLSGKRMWYFANILSKYKTFLKERLFKRKYKNIIRFRTFIFYSAACLREYLHFGPCISWGAPPKAKLVYDGLLNWLKNVNLFSDSFLVFLDALESSWIHSDFSVFFGYPKIGWNWNFVDQLVSLKTDFALFP